LIGVAAIGCILASPRALAIDPLTAVELREVCAQAAQQPEAIQTRLCLFYVKGFLDGAVATDSRVAENVASEMGEGEGFTERAIRTRVMDRLERFGPSVYAEFCVGQPDPIADVVLHVIEELDLYEELEGVHAQTVVYGALRRHYPCKT